FGGKRRSGCGRTKVAEAGFLPGDRRQHSESEDGHLFLCIPAAICEPCSGSSASANFYLRPAFPADGDRHRQPVRSRFWKGRLMAEKPSGVCSGPAILCGHGLYRVGISDCPVGKFTNSQIALTAKEQRSQSSF